MAVTASIHSSGKNNMVSMYYIIKQQVYIDATCFNLKTTQN